MIVIDLECHRKHRFEGFFKDHESFCSQLEKGIIQCSVCGSCEVRRIFSGCSIPKKTSYSEDLSAPDLFDTLRVIKKHVRENYQDVGCDFADKARAIHYGVEKERDIYGSTSEQELRELTDEGVPVLAIPDIEITEN